MWERSSDTLEVIQHVSESLERECRSSWLPDNVSILNRADLQNTYLSISFRTSLFDFFFLISTSFFVNVNSEVIIKNRRTFLSCVLEQQACYESLHWTPSWSFVVKKKRWWMPERWWRLSWNERFYLYSWGSSCDINRVQAFLLDRWGGFCI